MKKLMIAACAAALATVAQAGAVNWSAGNLTASPAVSSLASATYSAYLFIGDDVTAATQYLAGDTKDLDAFKTASAANKTSTYAASTGKMNFGLSGYGSYVSTTVSAYMIIFDASTVDAASNYLVATRASDGAQVITQTFGTSGNKSYAFGDQGTNTAWVSMGAVPEPTSGLLLLLGMAGLALKRKIA